MMQRIKQLVVSALLAVTVGFALAPVAAAPVFAVDPKANACTGIGGCSATTGPSITSVIKAVINILSTILGAIAVIMIIVSGLRYTTSGGDASKVSGAKNALIYSAVGLVVAAFAQLIAHFALSVGK